jgi:hypothetical protein
MASGSGAGFCASATDLVRELKRAQKFLPAYNENLVADVVAECNRSFANFIKPHQESVHCLRSILMPVHASAALAADQTHSR